MSIYILHQTQKIPQALPKVWDFISSPDNLKHITPPYMGFNVTSKNLADKMYPGMIISYKVSPVLGIPLTWVTEISQVRDMQFFVDEQRVGPYKLWHHQHHLQEIPGGVLMTDIVTYQPPFGVLGNIANALFIKRQLNTIFEFRRKKIEELFGVMPQ